MAALAPRLSAFRLWEAPKLSRMTVSITPRQYHASAIQVSECKSMKMRPPGESHMVGVTWCDRVLQEASRALPFRHTPASWEIPEGTGWL